jgi:hypothetical protein
MKKFNAFYLIFYILFRFAHLGNKKQTDKKILAHSSLSLMTLGAISVLLTVLVKSVNVPIFRERSNTMVVGGIICLAIYFLNEQLFLKNEKYLEIEKYFDEKTRLSDNTIILLALIIIIFTCFSFPIAIW